MTRTVRCSRGFRGGPAPRPAPRPTPRLERASVALWGIVRGWRHRGSNWAGRRVGRFQYRYQLWPDEWRRLLEPMWPAILPWATDLDPVVGWLTLPLRHRLAEWVGPSESPSGSPLLRHYPAPPGLPVGNPVLAEWLCRLAWALRPPPLSEPEWDGGWL